VTVVVAVFEAERTIGECVESLLALRYPPELRELVVVDNGSRDGTRQVLGGFGDALAVVDEATRGPAAARNVGVRAARGDVIALTDADCTVDPDWLTELVPPLADASVGIAGGTILARRPANAAELYGETIHDHRRSILHWRPPYVITMNWAARRSLFDEVGPFDEGLLRASDVEFSYRVVRAGYRLAFSPGAVVYHRNERSLAGLVHEGWVHGRHSVRLSRRHPTLVAEARARSLDTPREPVEPAPRSRFSVAFGLGKRAGRATARLERALRRT
jgi:glycosyltransferase involved in cell wall biosynthesis